MPRLNGGVVLQKTPDQQQVIAIDDLEIAKTNFPDAIQESGFAVTIPVVNSHGDLEPSITGDSKHQKSSSLIFGLKINSSQESISI